MRTLYLLRGAPASGKSTWIKENHLEPYTLSADNIRLMVQSPVLDNNGRLVITQKNDNKVWSLLMNMLENRMSRGEFCIVDATHYKLELIQKYKTLISKYRYRAFIVDFTDVSREELKRRNNKRDSYKYVPEEAIDKMYSVFESEDFAKQIPGYVKLLTRDEAINKLKEDPIFDFNEYEKVIVIPDLHGCYEPLKTYFEENPFNEKYFYCFLGDYIDRGLQNKEVLEFLFNIMNNKNVLMLEGNHECLHKDTEILTTDGWFNIADVVNNKLNVEPITYNIEKQELEKDEIKFYHKKHQDQMVHIKTCNTEQIVSLNHEVLLGDKKILAKDIFETNLNDLHKKILPTAQMNQEDYPITDDWLRLITWIVCDGSLVIGNKTNPNLIPKLRVQFGLAYEEKINNLCNILESLQIKYTKRPRITKSDRLQVQVICIYPSASYPIFKYFPNGKVFPEFFRNLSRRQCEIVLESISQTDGHTQNQKMYFHSTNLHNINILNELCIKNGYCFVTKKNQNRGYKKGSVIYCCKITKYWILLKNDNSVKIIDYDDDSYCITTNNGTLVTRLNNKCTITGNCWVRRYCSKEEKITITKGDSELLSKFMSKSDLYEIKDKHRLSPEFENNTIPQIESLDKSQLRRFCEKLGQFAYFKFGDNVYCLTHAGISNKPTLFTSTCEFIQGVGRYEENEEIYKAWNKNTPDNYVQIHGHRNVYNIDPIYDNKNINLNTSVEFGEDLRIASIDKNGVVDILYYKNPIFRERDEKKDVVYIHTEDELYKSLNESKFITKKLLDNDIISYNFSRNAFDKGIWNTITVKARGLFINSKTQNVTCRSYSKFFNIEEVPETEFRNLKASIQYPLIGYKKENGFLGLVSWDKDNNELFVASKSTNKGDYADLVRKHFFNLEQHNHIINWLKENDFTLIFEVIDIENDPHIIKYDKSKLVLLDIVKNKLDGCEKIDYNTLQQLSTIWKIEYKLEDLKFNNWEEFYRFYNRVKEDRSIHHEGWVFEDVNGFMFKYKTSYYRFWKFMRSMKDAIVKGRQIHQTFKDAYEVEVINFMRGMDIEHLNKMSIIDVRDRFLKEKYFEGPCLEPQKENNNE